MSGCFGSDPEDRYFENQLLNYLDDDYCCDLCGCDESAYGGLIENDNGQFICPECNDRRIENE